jgi:hypothetical protein
MSIRGVYQIERPVFFGRERQNKDMASTSNAEYRLLDLGRKKL